MNHLKILSAVNEPTYLHINNPTLLANSQRTVSDIWQLLFCLGNGNQTKCLLPTLKCILLSLLLLAGCRSQVQMAESPAPKIDGEKIVLPEGSPQMTSLTVEAVEPCKTTLLHLNGRLVWDDDVTVRVYSPFAGRVTKILTEPGKEIRKGEPLAWIASPDFGQAQSDARKAASDFILTERTLNRVRELLEHGAAPLKDVQIAEADFARAQSEKQRTAARLELYGASPETIDQVYELKSPINGVVVEKNLNPGQEVRADQMLANAPQFFSPMFVVTDPTRLWLLIDASEMDLSNLKRGQIVQIRTHSLRDKVFEGRIEAVSDFLDPNSRTIKVRAVVNNAQRLLKAEMFVSVDLSSEPHNGIDVPTHAVFLKGESRYVFLEEGIGQYVRRQVKAGLEHDGKILVLDGIQNGQRVVTNGCLLLDQLLQTSRGS